MGTFFINFHKSLTKKPTPDMVIYIYAKEAKNLGLLFFLFFSFLFFLKKKREREVGGQLGSTLSMYVNLLYIFYIFIDVD